MKRLALSLLALVAIVVLLLLRSTVVTVGTGQVGVSTLFGRVTGETLGEGIHLINPLKNVTELIAYARANPGAINWGTTGAGAGGHLSGSWLHGATKTEITFIHYKGAGPMNTDLVAGRVDLMFDVLPSSRPHAQAGRLRVLAITDERCSALLPEVREADVIGGRLTATAAAQLGLRAGMPMLTGIMDGSAGMLLAGARPGFDASSPPSPPRSRDRDDAGECRVCARHTEAGWGAAPKQKGRGRALLFCF